MYIGIRYVCTCMYICAYVYMPLCMHVCIMLKVTSFMVYVQCYIIDS